MSFCPNFTIDENNKEAYNLIFMWLTGIKNDNIDPCKGLAFFGNFGTGKDIAMRIAMQLASHPFIVEKSGLKRGARIVSAKEIRDELLVSLSSNSFSDYYEWNKQSGKPNPINISISDFGKEEKRLMVFGNETNPLERILCTRYDIWQRMLEYSDKSRMIFTHFSTNLTPSKIEEDYGSRVVDRLKEMVNIVQFYGQSRRK